MIRFEYSHSSAPDDVVVFEMHEDSKVDDVVATFERFLRAATFPVSGHVVMTGLEH